MKTGVREGKTCPGKERKPYASQGKGPSRDIRYPAFYYGSILLRIYEEGGNKEGSDNKHQKG